MRQIQYDTGVRVVAKWPLERGLKQSHSFLATPLVCESTPLGFEHHFLIELSSNLGMVGIANQYQYLSTSPPFVVGQLFTSHGILTSCYRWDFGVLL